MKARMFDGDLIRNTVLAQISGNDIDFIIYKESSSLTASGCKAMCIETYTFEYDDVVWELNIPNVDLYNYPVEDIENFTCYSKGD